MSPSNAEMQSVQAYNWARLKAVVRQAFAAVQGEKNTLLAYDEVRRKVRAGLPTYKGVRPIPINRIIGSVSRYRDFDRAFMPTQDYTADRWKRVGLAYFSQIILPPVEVYQVGDVYFVIDGNHRVSVARLIGREFIDAEVLESRARVPLTADISADDLEVIGEKTDFLEATHLDETYPEVNIDLTIPGGYHLLLEHIEVHRYLQSTEWNREFSTLEAAGQWFDQVYRPIVGVIRGSGILEEFPGRTEGDLYLWIIEHQYYLRQKLGREVSAEDAAQSFARHFSHNPFHRFWHWLTVHVLRLGRD